MSLITATLREAKPEDLLQVLSIFEACIDISCIDDYSESERRVWKSSSSNHAKWLKRIEEQSFWLATEGDDIVGFASLEGKDYIDCMYVSPEAQGRGIAKLLLTKMEELARRNSISTIYSDVSYTARPFFEKNKFLVDHPNRNEKDGEVLVNFRVHKSLI